nr:MAG TPA_asm: hypothetical protein [Caudoviricetes sp.]
MQATKYQVVPPLAEKRKKLVIREHVHAVLKQLAKGQLIDVLVAGLAIDSGHDFADIHAMIAKHRGDCLTDALQCKLADLLRGLALLFDWLEPDCLQSLLVESDISDRLDDTGKHVDGVGTLDLTELHLFFLLSAGSCLVSLASLSCGSGGGHIHLKRNGILSGHRVMRGVFKGKSTLFLVRSLQLKTTRGESIHHVDGDKTSLCARSAIDVDVGIITHPPKVCKILGLKVISRRDLGGRDIGKADKALCGLGVHRYRSTGKLDFPRVKTLKLHRIFRAIVNVLTKVRKRRGSRKINATRRCGKNILVTHLSRSGGKARTKNTRV